MMNDQELSKLIGKAARNNNIPEIRHANRPHSPGFIDVYLCGVEIECFDTYYYTAAQKAGDLVSSLNVRIRDCASDIIKEKDDANVLLKVELVELRKANAELEKDNAHLKKEADKHRAGFVACMTGEQFTIHNLKQEAKGIELLIREETSVGRLHNGDKRSFIFCQDAKIRALELLGKAKSLKAGN